MHTFNEQKNKFHKFDFVFVHPHLEYGGAERQTVLISNALVKRGMSVAIFLHQSKGGLLSELDPRVSVYSFLSDNHIMTPLAAFSLLLFLRRVEPTVVVAKLWSSVFVLGLARKLLNHRLYFYENLDPKEHVKYIRFGFLKQKIVKRIFLRSENLIANSKSTLRSMMDVYGLKNQPQIIFPCLDLDQVKKLSLKKLGTNSTGSQRIVVVSIGRLTHLKGFDIALKALIETGLNIEWLVIGDGELRHELPKWVCAAPSIKITMLGTLNNPYPAISQADLLLHCSRSESFGAVLIEALALRIPVVATFTAGSREISTQIEDSYALQLASSSNTYDLALKIRNAVENPIEPPRWELVEKHLGVYSLQGVVEQWLDIRRAFEEGGQN